MNDDNFTAERQAWLREQQRALPKLKAAPRFPYQPARLHTLEAFKQRLRRHMRQVTAC